MVYTDLPLDAEVGISAILRYQEIMMKQQQTLAFASAYFIFRMSPYKHHEAPDSAQ